MNEVDSHNKSRQSDLELEKWWVNQCGSLRLCKTVDMGMTITNCWKLFLYGVKRDHYKKFIGIRELSEQLAQYSFKILFRLRLGPRQKTYLPLMMLMKDRQFLLAVQLIYPVIFSFHRGHNYFRHNSQQCFVVCLYFGDFYYRFSTYFRKRRK